MGDEVRRTQGGNNNAYGHDDATSWFDWTAVERARRPAALHARPHPARAAGWPTVLALPDDASLLDLLAERIDRVERRGARRAGPGPRLAQRRADRARRPGRPAPRSSTPTGSRSSSRCPRPTSSTEAGDGSSTRASHRPTTSPSTSDDATGGRRTDLPRRGHARSSSWRRAGRTDDPAAGGRRHDRRRTQADGGRRPPGERLARGQPVVRVGSVSRRAGLGRRPRGLHAPAATPGARSRTTTPARGRTAGTRTGWRA